MGIPDNELELLTNQYLEEVEDNITVELAEFNGEHWTINDKETAMKVDYVLHKLEEKIAADEALSESQKAPLQAKIDKLEEGKAKIDEWLERSTKVDRTSIENLKTHLHLYHRRVMEAEELENEKRIAEGKKPLKISKSIKLTYRDLISKVQQPEIKKDDTLLKEWVEDNYSTQIKTYTLKEFIKTKEENEDYYITTSELMDFINQMNSEFIVRETNLAWDKLKKTLVSREVNIIETIDGQKVVVGKRLAYFDDCGIEIPHVKLIERGIKFDWKPNN